MKTNAHAYRRELRRPVSLISFEIFQISSDGNRAQKLYDLCPFKAANITLFQLSSLDSTLFFLLFRPLFRPFNNTEILLITPNKTLKKVVIHYFLRPLFRPFSVTKLSFG